MRLKVCHLDTERSWRGGEQQIFYLAQGLRAAGDENLIAARDGSALFERAKAEGFEVMALNPCLPWAPASAFALRRALLKGGFHVLHAHTAHAAAIGALSTWATDISFIVSRRVDFHISHNPLTRWKYGRADRIVAVSTAVQKVLLQDGIEAGRVTVVHSGIDPARFLKGERVSRVELGLPLEGPLIGQVAALAPHKDPLNFLRAMALIKESRPDVHGIMVGAGPLEGEVRRELERLGLAGTVLLMGFREDAHRILRHLDVFTLSSCLEGLGTSVLDAMALGVPVVATRTGGLPEMVEDGVSGLLVPPKNARALAAAMQSVLEDTALRERLKAGGLRTVERFSAQAMVRETRAIYEQVRAGWVEVP